MPGRNLLVVLLLSCCLLAAGGASASAAGAGAAPAASAAEQAAAADAAVAAKRPGARARGVERQLAGWALLDGRVRLRGARVEVTARGGGPSLLVRGTRGRTTRHGTFAVRLAGRLPRRVVVTVSGGRAGAAPFRGRLRAIVARPARGVELTHVNPVTTIVAAHARLRPRAGLGRSRAAVRRILSLRPGEDLGSSLRRSGAAFDGRRFLARARRAGGVERYAAALARRAAGGGRPLRFAGAPRAGAASGTSIADIILTALVDGAVEGPEDDAIGWVLDGIGFGDDDGGQLAAISQQLDELLAETRRIEQQVEQLAQQQDELAAEVARSEYATLVAGFPAAAVGGSEDEVLADLVWLVEHAASQCASGLAGCAGALPAGKDPAGWCASPDAKPTAYLSVACDALLRIRAADLADTLPRSIDAVGGTAGADGILAVYQQSKFAALKATRGFVTEDYANDAARIYRHFAAIEALQANYLTQLWNAEDQPADLLVTRLRAIQADVAAQARLLPNELPAASAVDAKSGRMWALAESPALPFGDGVGECFPANSSYLWWWHLRSRSGACQFYVATALGRTAGVSGWQLPSKGDLDTLPGNGDGVPADTLTRAMDLPDVSQAARSFPVPAPNVGVLAPGVGPMTGDWHRNPGTAYGLATADCTDHVRWNSGLTAGDGYDDPVFAQGRFCDYVDLATGQVRRQCVWGDDGYYGCDMPVSSKWSNRIGYGSGPLDYGHPLVVLLWRTPAAAEGWFKQ